MLNWRSSSTLGESSSSSSSSKKSSEDQTPCTVTQVEKWINQVYAIQIHQIHLSVDKETSIAGLGSLFLHGNYFNVAHATKDNSPWNLRKETWY
jgi:hypothetical protein